MKNDKIKTFILLHIMLLVFSFATVLSKTAAGYSFMNLKFCICLLGLVLILGVYAIGWQQVIKKLPLTTAFSNKAVTVVWGIVWGHLFFGEIVNLGKIVGALIVIAGIVLYATSDSDRDSLSDDSMDYKSQ